MEVYKKLLSVQTKLKAPKSQHNSFGNYGYRSCEDILEAVKPHLEEVGCTLYIRDMVEIHGASTYITAHAFFVDCDDGSVIEAWASAREEQSKKGMDVAQITGSASSYARKYALSGLFCIDDTKDSDTDEQKTETAARAAQENKASAKEKPPVAKKEEPASTAQARQANNPSNKNAEETISDVDISVLRDYFADNGISEEKILKKYSYKSFREMPCRIFANITNPSSLNYFKQKCGVDT